MSTVQSATSSDVVASKLQQALAASQVAAGANAPASSANATDGVIGTANEQQDRFLKLLVAQMRNQDPLNPLDNAQVTSQMAQISTVTGIEKLNQAMAKLAEATGMRSPLDAVGAIGRSALVEGDRIDRVSETDGPVRAGFVLSSAADSGQVEILDAAGKTVFATQFGPAGAGMHMFQWDATGAPAGVYQLKVTAVAGGQPVTATPLTAVPVLGVSQGSDGVRLELSGRPGVLVKDVKAIL